MFPRWKNTLDTSFDPQSGSDLVFLRNTGITLVALTLAVGAISVVGSLKTSNPVVLAQSVDVSSSAAGLKED